MLKKLNFKKKQVYRKKIDLILLKKNIDSMLKNGNSMGSEEESALMLKKIDLMLKKKRKNLSIVDRKKNVLKEEALPLPRKKSLHNKLLGSIVKKGKKNLAKKALNNSLFLTSKLYRIASYKIISKILGKIKCYAEIRKVTKRKITTLIPFPISKSRQQFLKIKWFLHGTKINKSRVAFSQKISEECEKNFEKPKYLKTQRTLMNKELIKNISNAHFRWK